MRFISIVTNCYNEEGNVKELYTEVRSIFQSLGGYAYEHIFIDNASGDKTVSILKELAKEDKNLKIIVNLKDFGQERSPCHALLQAKGDAVILVAADFQNPPQLIKSFLEKWEKGHKVVLGVREKSKENIIARGAKNLYYFLISKFSDTPQIKNFTGFGLYDRSFIEILRKLDDPAPYLRGLVADFGTERAQIKYAQPARRKGRSHNNFFTLFDIAMLGFTSHSIIPLRLSVFIGFITALASLLIAVVYVILKLMFWNAMPLGIAPLIIGIFFFSAVQLFFIGILGEYVGAIYTQVKKRPLVIEKERVNF